jgi:hypothetical protein
MIVSNETGIFISLDGTDFASSVEITRDKLVTDLTSTYPNHNNQWASSGLFAVSSNGIPNADTSKFNMYTGYGVGKKYEAEEEYDNDWDKTFFTTKVLLNTKLVKEEKPSTSNIFIAFDFFLKNISGSPKSDNLYFNEGTEIKYNGINFDDWDGVINSLRIGLVKVGSVPLKSSVSAIQNISCNNKCEMIIYEPKSTRHSEASIKRATKYGVKLVDGEYSPTYSVISEGTELELANGQIGSNIELDSAHFALQNTITDADFEKPIFEVPNAITKMRAYIWIEGQDMDSLETGSNGGAISVIINLIKDLAGYY